MASCVCACKAYGGACACRFDGRSSGLVEGESNTVKKIVAWLRARPESILCPDTCQEELAKEIARGDWR